VGKLIPDSRDMSFVLSVETKWSGSGDRRLHADTRPSKEPGRVRSGLTTSGVLLHPPLKRSHAEADLHQIRTTS